MTVDMAWMLGALDRAFRTAVFQAVALAINRLLIERFGRFVEGSMILGFGCSYRQHLIDERICPDSRVFVPIIE
jgi:hypothetical protein